MPVRFVDDGQPEARDFDENYEPLAPAKPPRHRDWRALDIRRNTPSLVIAPKDVRFFQWLETPPRKISNDWKSGFLRRLFC